MMTLVLLVSRSGQLKQPACSWKESHLHQWRLQVLMDQRRPHDKVGQGRQTGVCECAHWSGYRDSSYNAAANCSVELSILDDVPCLAPRPWVSFSMLKMSEALKACSNVSALGPDHITWRYLKSILADDICVSGILSLTNSCITL